MAQLVERRVRNAKVRGSNPLISTTKYRTFVRYFFMWDRGFPRFHRGVALQHEPLRANASKHEQVHFLRYYGSVQVASYEAPYLHHKISYICTIFFLCGNRGFPRFHRGVALQHEPLRANASKHEQVHFLRYYGSVQVASYESPLSPQQKSCLHGFI